MIISKKALPRRTVLRGIGATLALPLLDSMIPALSAFRTTAANPVRRLGVVYVPNGMSMSYWTPKADGVLFESTPILEPLAPFRNQLLVVSGLTNKQAEAQAGEGAGDHSRGPAAFLTGAHVRRTEGADVRADISIDQLIARELGKETQLASLEVALESTEVAGSCDPGYSCAYSGTIAWRTPTMPLPMENDPRAVFERLFGSSDSTDPQARALDALKNRSLLDSVTKQVAHLQKALGAHDRVKLTEYLEAVRDVERRIQKTEEQSTRELPVVEQPAGIPASFEEHAKLMFDLLALAYQCDLTRVFTFMVAREQSARAYPESGVSDAHHPTSHHQNDPVKLAKLAKINVYHMKMFASFLEKLRSTPDGDGSLLDHSMILYGGGISDGDRHSHDNLPVLVIGGGSGQLNGGRHLRVSGDTPLMNLHLSLLDKMGVPLERLGDSTGRLEPLSI